MAGGLAGSVTVLVLKYVVPGYQFPTLGFGVSNVVANALIMFRYPHHPALRFSFSAKRVLIIVRLCCGFRRTSRRMIIITICRFRGMDGRQRKENSIIHTVP